MSITFGGLSFGSRTEADGTFCQEGEIHVLKGDEQDVYYPAPYAGPPNLELTDNVDQCLVLEQKPDHFRVRNPGPFESTLHWKARGLRVAAVPVVTPPPPPVPAGPAHPPPCPGPGS
jgi:hypothetical protein